MIAYLKFAEKLADATQSVILKYFRSKLNVTNKPDESPVSEADTHAEKIMRSMIEKNYPEHGIIGEEFGSIKLESEFVWVLDPIDGTQSFVTGKPIFGTLIALLYQGTPIVGVINMPALSERWTGAKGIPTLFQGSPVKARPCLNLHEAWLYVTSPDMFTEKNYIHFKRLKSSVHRTIYGAECQAYGLLASGWTDIVCEDTMKIYDYAALVPIIEGANGTITDWHGFPLGLESNGTVIACATKNLHNQSLQLLK